MLACLPLLALAVSAVQAWSSDNHTCALQQRFYSCEVPKNTLVDTCCTPEQGLGESLCLVYRVNQPSLDDPVLEYLYRSGIKRTAPSAKFVVDPRFMVYK
jgi:hypothetical protein